MISKDSAFERFKDYGAKTTLGIALISSNIYCIPQSLNNSIITQNPGILSKA